MIKEGVILYGVRPELVFCLIFIEKVFESHGIECVPTSVTGKKHGTLSLHPVGYAVDLRTKHILGGDEFRKDVITAIIHDIQKYVPQCDAILEHFGEPQEHIHVEFDPQDDLKFQTDKAKYRASGSWPE